MNILHIDILLIDNNYAELHYLWDNRNDLQRRQISLADIADLIKQAEAEYFISRQERTHLEDLGHRLYRWLNGSGLNLTSAIDNHGHDGIILAIAASEKLAHLPWEILHDGEDFLVNKIPAIIPIRWAKGNGSQQLTLANKPPVNRALNVLFMATSPLEITPELDFEAEEAQILLATKRQPLSLIVEESGCLKELGYLVSYYEKDYFDVIHLTGHATFKDGEPYFITETEFGEAEYSSAKDIAKELQFQYPKLISLSGCNTAYSRQAGTVTSMAEALLKKGATAVIGWGQSVLDTEATDAAAAFYKELSTGKTVTEAFVLTCQTLLKNQAEDWHLLRLYVAEKLPGALVNRGHKPPLPLSSDQRFLDPERRIRVASREDFVGRRRQLQNCLRVLKRPDSGKIGVLIHGMGGLGKSSIAARLSDRLPEHKIIVFWRKFSKSIFLEELTGKLENQKLGQILQKNKDVLKYRLKNVFSQLNEKNKEPFLFIFDDFEWNLDYCEKRYSVNNKEVVDILEALIWAIQETNAYHRIIITCRYDFDSDLLQSFYKQPLESFRKSDVQKKLIRLKNFNSEGIEQRLIEQAQTLADGNPRLLEWLNEVLSGKDAKTEISKYEASSQDWREKIIWEQDNTPKLQIDQSIEQIVSQCLVFEIPVPMPALEALCVSIPGYNKQQLNRAIEVGLIEVSSEVKEENRVYRVSRVLPHIIPNIQLPEAPEVYSLYRKAYEKLQRLFVYEKNENQEQWQELFRLKFADIENIDRFRQAYCDLLFRTDGVLRGDYQNYEVYIVLTHELKKRRHELAISNLFDDLEQYLRQQEWQKADEETGWIFYQVIMLPFLEDTKEVYEHRCWNMFEKINSLWEQYSEGKFSLLKQANIYHASAEKVINIWTETLMSKMSREEQQRFMSMQVEDIQRFIQEIDRISILHNTMPLELEILEEFSKQVGWKQNLNVDQLNFSLEANDGHLPCFCNMGVKIIHYNTDLGIVGLGRRYLGGTFLFMGGMDIKRSFLYRCYSQGYKFFDLYSSRLEVS